MRVKAKWNVKDASGWHSAGEVFDTESDLGASVEVLDAPKTAETVQETKATAKGPETEVRAPEKTVEAPRTTSRRKKGG